MERLNEARKALARYEDRNSKPNPAHLADALRGLIALAEESRAPQYEYEVTYSSASAPSIDGYRMRMSSGMLPSLAAAMEWVGFSVNPMVHRRTKAVPAGEWERVEIDQEGTESR